MIMLPAWAEMKPMKTGVSVCSQRMAGEALSTMELNQPGPLTMYFIVDDDGKPVGLLHIHDILKAGFGAE